MGVRLFDHSRRIREGLLLVFLFSLPFPQKISSIVLGFLLLVTLIDFFGTPAKRYIKVGWFLPVLFFYYLISELVSAGAWSSIERRFIYLAIPVAFAMNENLFTPMVKTKIKEAYVLGNVMVVLFCLVRSVVLSVSFEGGHFQFTPEILPDPTKDFLSSSVYGGNYFFGHEFSPFLDPMYFGLYIVFAQCLIFELARSQAQKIKRWALVGCYILLSCALFLLSSKAAIISSLIVTTVIVIYLLLQVTTHWVVRLSTVGVLLLMSILFISYNPRVKLFRETFWERLSINQNARFGHDLRILSWDASIDIIKDNLWIGVGEGRKQAVLSEMYVAKGYVFPARDQLNSHNQYLDLLLGGGLIALGLFLTGFLQLAIGAIKERNHLLVAFCILFAFHALFENLLSRYAGILIFAAFISLLKTEPSQEAKV